MISILCPKCNNTVWVNEKQSSCFCTYCGVAMAVATKSPQVTNIGGAEMFLEKALLVLEDSSFVFFEKERIAQTKDVILTGLSLEPDNMKLLFALSLCSGFSSYSEKYFQKSKGALTTDECKIIERLKTPNPTIIENRLIILCFFYKAADKISSLLQNYPDMFTPEKLLLKEKTKLLESRDYLSLFMKQGGDINDAFRIFIHRAPTPIFSSFEEIMFEENALPLNIFEMYLDLGLDVNFKIKVNEPYKIPDGDYYKTEYVVTEMDLYSFFEVFESSKVEAEGEYGSRIIYSGKHREEKDKFGRDCGGSVSYRFKYKNNRPNDYMAALVKHGYEPKPKPEKSNSKRRFPWF